MGTMTRGKEEKGSKTRLSTGIPIELKRKNKRWKRKNGCRNQGKRSKKKREQSEEDRVKRRGNERQRKNCEEENMMKPNCNKREKQRKSRGCHKVNWMKYIEIEEENANALRHANFLCPPFEHITPVYSFPNLLQWLVPSCWRCAGELLLDGDSNNNDMVHDCVAANKTQSCPKKSWKWSKEGRSERARQLTAMPVVEGAMYKKQEAEDVKTRDH